MSDTNDVQSIIQEAIASFDEHRMKKFRELLSQDAILIPGGKALVIEGPNAIVEAIQPTLDAIPDLTVKITNTFTCANKGVVEVIRSGTHTGVARLPNGQLVNPTGKKVELPECLVFEVL